MRLPPRRILASNKRKDKEDTTCDSSKSSAPSLSSLVATMEPVVKPTTAVVGYDEFTEPVGSNNQLLAGYLAHEFLSKGTLFGEPMSQAENCPSPIYVKAKKIKPSMERETKAAAMVKSEQNIGKRSERYLEVSKLLKMEGAHLPGIINPTQLAQFLQM
ncbi:unnamed protein product [Linum trigynum]|uniref:Uncharacterized protein n=1 Tax=Linum trigynum TaxID=586398 RepID=A0AAV2CL36_9ROSI